MMDISSTTALNTSKTEKIPFTRYDLGWVVLCIGMAIGAGIIYLPIQVGLKGIWVFLAALLLAYPACYWMQALYLKSLSETSECEDYSNVISQYLGKNWGVVLGVLYLLMLFKGILGYSLTITIDSAKYLQTFGVTEGLLSQNIWYILGLLTFLVLIAAQGERLLFRISGPMVVAKVAIVVLFGIVMVPYWDFSNIPGFPPVLSFVRDTILTLPFALFSILFLQILSPMNIAFRKTEPDPQKATYRALRVNLIAFIVLVVCVLFFALSFTFSINHEQAVSAKQQNISALALAASVLSGKTIAIMSVLLNVFAIVTAFFAIFLGVYEAFKGIIINLLSRIMNVANIPNFIVQIGICAIIILILWGWVALDFSVIAMIQFLSPLNGIVGFIIPCCLILKVPALRKFITPSYWYVFGFGVVFCLAPLLKFFE
ncbi:amino acid permease [Bartonella sp. HY038]|uniref:amino acid permease n=1 Tax=Bartonella sp. HY038 TaxID=2759660 RepID=UPI00352CA23B